MRDAPTPAQLLALRDAVVPEPNVQDIGVVQAFCWHRDRFQALSPRDAIAELEALVRARGARFLAVEGHENDPTGTPGAWIARWHVKGITLANGKAPTEPLARFLALIHAFVALDMLTEEQAREIEGVEPAHD